MKLQRMVKNKLWEQYYELRWRQNKKK